MKKLLYFFVFLFLAEVFIPVGVANAYRIASNHSYVKNSDFTTDYDIKAEGYGDFKAIYKNRKDEETGKKDTETILDNEISVNINLEGELDEITKYGIKFIQTFNNNFKKEREYYAYVNGYYGKLELGNTTSVAENMRIGADTIALGSGGVASNFTRYINFANTTISPSSSVMINPTYILGAGMLSSQNFGYHNISIVNDDEWESSKYLTKVSYYSPEFYGLQVGVGITPNVILKGANLGTINNTTINNNVRLGNFIDYGITYINTFDTVGIAASFVGEQNISNNLNRSEGVKERVDHSFKSTEAGLNINYFGLTLAISNGRLEREIEIIPSSSVDERNLKSITQEKGKYSTYGVSYELDEFSFSVTYFKSEYKDYTEFSSTSIAVEDKMSKNISVYAEYINFKSEYVPSSIEEKGYNVILGLLLNFN